MILECNDWSLPNFQDWYRRVGVDGQSDVHFAIANHAVKQYCVL